MKPGTERWPALKRRKILELPENSQCNRWRKPQKLWGEEVGPIYQELLQITSQLSPPEQPQKTRSTKIQKSMCDESTSICEACLPGICVVYKQLGRREAWNQFLDMMGTAEKELKTGSISSNRSWKWHSDLHVVDPAWVPMTRLTLSCYSFPKWCVCLYMLGMLQEGQQCVSWTPARHETLRCT